MSDQYIGEIRMFGGNFAPMGWALCDGRRLNISGNEALYALIGTTYGGDGTTSFNLPDLRGRIPIHRANDYPIGRMAGAETVALVPDHLPAHSHAYMATADHGDAFTPAGGRLAQAPGTIYSNDLSSTTTLAADSILAIGGTQKHDNVQPFLCVTFIIALEGEYPTRT